MSNRKSEAFILLSVLATIWGASFILMVKGLASFTPFQVGTIRILSASLVLLPFIVSKFKTIQKKSWPWIFASGMLGNAIPAVLFPYAETVVSSSVAGILNSSVNKFQVMGLALGFIGACFLITKGKFDLDFTQGKFILLIIIATVMYACSVNIIRHKLRDINPILLTGFALLFGGFFSFIYLFSTHSFAHIVKVGFSESLVAILVLGVMGSAISTVIFNRLINISNTIFATSVTYIIPIIALIIGWYFNEEIVWSHLAGLGLILSGVYLINKG
jgi:drug/metabolite transporter (DMT)-like permease